MLRVLFKFLFDILFGFPAKSSRSSRGSGRARSRRA